MGTLLEPFVTAFYTVIRTVISWIFTGPGNSLVGGLNSLINNIFN